MRLREGRFIVLEGADATGKSTQLERLKVYFPDAHFTHQPSGSSPWTNQVYRVMEDQELRSPLARQFLHLACHAEHYLTDIIPRLDDGQPVVMDRYWLSTLVYGHRAFDRFDMHLVERMVAMPTWGVTPDLVFVFTHTYQEDPHNTPEVIDGYRQAAGRGGFFVPVPEGTMDEVTQFLLKKLIDSEMVDI